MPAIGYSRLFSSKDPSIIIEGILYKEFLMVNGVCLAARENFGTQKFTFSKFHTSNFELLIGDRVGPIETT